VTTEQGRTAEDLPAANQQKTEPMPPSPPQGENFVSDPDTSGEMPVDPPHGLADPTGRVAPPDGVTTDAASMSQTGNARPSIAQQGKPDGEVDTSR
jgi:hypothetical protein